MPLAVAGTISFPIVFFAGLFSCLSPCVLPLLPAYLSYMGGMSVDLVKEGKAPARKLLPPAIFFVLGFSTVFVMLGLSATFIGSLLARNQDLLTRVGGAVIILMGLAFIGLVPFPLLYSERRFEFRPAKTLAGTYLMGFVFGFGWSPCVGIPLSAALAVAATEHVPGRGALLLLTFSIGLGIPFILAALGVNRLMGVLSWVRKHQQSVTRTSGVMLVAVGALFLFNRVFWLSILFQRAMDALHLGFLSRV
jgi:cytochrome c-type biogenesis protein